VGLTGGSDGFGEERISCPCRVSNPVAVRYTNYAIPAPLSVNVVCKFVTKILDKSIRFVGVEVCSRQVDFVVADYTSDKLTLWSMQHAACSMQQSPPSCNV
jgi:hypothetical protein